MLMLENFEDAKAKMASMDKAAFNGILSGLGYEVPENANNIVVSLKNADGACTLYKMYEHNAKGIMIGAKIAKNILGAKGIIVVLREGFENLEALVNEGAAFVDENVSFEYGLCNKRAHAEDFIIDLVAAAKLAGSVAGNDIDGVPVFVNDAEPVFVKYGTKFSDVVSEDFKAVRIGNALYGASVKDAVVDENFPVQNGVVRTYSENECAVKAASEITHELRERSCGKCVFCREGLAQIDTVLVDFTAARGRATDIDFMAGIIDAMDNYSNCSLGLSASGAAKGLIKDFEAEAKEHLQKVCKTLNCKSMVKYYIDPKLCKGEAVCTAACKYKAITGGKDFINVIDEFDCKKCGECVSLCPNGAIKIACKIPANVPDKPVPLKEGLVAEGESAAPVRPTGGRPRPRRR